MSLAFATWKAMLSDEGQGCGETQSFQVDFSADYTDHVMASSPASHRAGVPSNAG